MHSPQVLSFAHKDRNKDSVYRLDNSFAEPLTSLRLLWNTIKRGDLRLIWQSVSHDLGYAYSGGSFDLRLEISRLYGPKIGPDNVVVFTGAQIAIKTAALTILDKNSHCIVVTPSYQSLQEAPLFANSTVTKVSVQSEDNWELNLQAIKGAIQSNTKCIITNDPHNPTGSLMCLQNQTRLSEMASENGIYVLSDEVNRLLEYKKSDRLPAMAEVCAQAVSISTMSKPWGGGGMDVGWAVFQDVNLRKKMHKRMYFETVSNSRAGELQAIMALRASDEILGRNCKIIKKNLQLLDVFLEDYRDWFEWIRPKAGATGFIKFKGPYSAEELSRKLAEVGIAVKPASVFGDADSIEQYFRVGFGGKTLPLALEAFREFVEEHKSKW